MEDSQSSSYQIGTVYYRHLPSDQMPHYAGRFEQMDEKGWKKFVNSAGVVFFASPRTQLLEASMEQIKKYF